MKGKTTLSAQFITCLTAFAALPLILFCLVFFPYLNHSLLTARMENLEGLARAHAAALEETGAALLRESRRLGRSEVIRAALLSGDGAGAQAYLETLVGEGCLGALLVDGQGRLAAATHSAYGDALPELAVAVAALAGAPAVSGLMPAAAGGGHSFYLAAPVQAEETVIGALVEEVPVSFFDRKTSDFRQGETGRMILADHSGLVISGTGETLAGSRLPQAIMDRLGAYQAGRREMSGVGTAVAEGVKVGYGYRILSNLPWMLVITQAQSEMRSQEALLVVYAALAVLGLALLALCIGRAVGRSALYPIRRLNRAFRQTQVNHFERVEPAGAAEFVALAQGYNRMVELVERNISHLSDANRQLAAAIADMEIQRDRLAFMAGAPHRGETAHAQINLVSGEFTADRAFTRMLRLDRSQTRFNAWAYVEAHLDARDRAALEEQLGQQADQLHLQLTLTAGGTRRPVALHAQVYYGVHAQPVRADVTLVDAGASGAEEADIATGLPGAKAFLEALAREAASPDGGAAVCLRTDPPPSGEAPRLRRQLADRLRAFAAPEGMVCSGGEDTYLVRLPGPFDSLALDRRLTELLRLAQSPALWPGGAWTPKAAAGAARYGQGYETSGEAALSQAMAMAGPSGVALYDPAWEERQQAKRRQAIREALAGLQGLSLDYQPIVAVSGHEVAGFEGTLRLSLPGLGLISAGEIIPVGEAEGLMGPVGRWIIQTALDFIQGIRRRQGREYFVSLNLSGQQLADPAFADGIYTALKASGLPGSALQLEISEARLMAELTRQGEPLRLLRQLGVRIALDDYGAGALSHLYNMPLDALKIDKSFLVGVAASPGREFILRTLVDVAHQLHLQVTAVGVEHPSRLSILEELGCDLAQGYHFCPPLPPAALEVWLDTQGK